MNATDTDTRKLYFNLLTDTFNHSAFIDDVGLVPGNPRNILKKPVGCSWNREYPYSRDYPCGQCEVCMAFRTKGKFEGLRKKMPDPVVHDYVFFTLSLPKWPTPLPVVNGCKNLGELLYWTPSLIERGQREGLRVADYLNAIKKAGFNAVESCFPGYKLGVVVFLHLADDYLQFSPHLHGVVCATAMDDSYWPLKQDASGDFPQLAQAWRKVMGRGHLSVRDFQKQLQKNWAEGIGNLFDEKFTKLHGVLMPSIATKNIGYQFLQQHGHLAQGIGTVIGDAVLADSKCVDARRMKWNTKTGEEDPEAAFGSVLKYGLSGQMKRTEFRDLGGWMFKVSFRKAGELNPCGRRELLYRRLVQLHYAARGVRRYQAKGLCALALGGRGTPYSDALLEVMNRGYPRQR